MGDKKSAKDSLTVDSKEFVMEITGLGILIIPITIFVFLFKRQLLVPLAIVLAPFQGGSIFNAENFSVSPYYFALIFVCLDFFAKRTKIFIDGKIKMTKYNNTIKFILMSLHLFFLYSFISLFFPLMFDGIGVYSADAGGIEGGFHHLGRLTLGLSNFAQLIYLFINIIFIHEVLATKMNSKEKMFYDTLAVSGIMIAIISIWQLSQIAFPNDFFNSNSRFIHWNDVEFSSGRRLSGTFSEPSYNSSVLASFAVMAINSFFLLRKSLFYFVSSITYFSILSLTIASTGLISFLIGVITTLPFTLKKVFLSKRTILK